jgi:hypothetical protein
MASSRFSSIPESIGEWSNFSFARRHTVFDLRSYRPMETGAGRKKFLLSLGESVLPTTEAVIFDYVVSWLILDIDSDGILLKFSGLARSY